jgi:hypothetical protein
MKVSALLISLFMLNPYCQSAHSRIVAFNLESITNVHHLDKLPEFIHFSKSNMRVDFNGMAVTKNILVINISSNDYSNFFKRVYCFYIVNFCSSCSWKFVSCRYFLMAKFFNLFEKIFNIIRIKNI